LRRNQISPFRAIAVGDSIPALLEGSINEVVHTVLELEDMAGASKRATIPLHVPAEWTERGMEGLARSVREFMRIGDGVVFDYFELFESFGFRVAVLPMDESVSSISYYDPGNYNAFFFVNARHNAERQLFRLAYELGHIYLETDLLLRPASISPIRKSEEDRGEKMLDAHHSASKFAAFFLMPAGAVRATVEQLGLKRGKWSYEIVLRLKHRFGVSAETFLYRLNELGYASDGETETIAALIKAHYQRTGYGEPGSSRRLLTPNGRIWDWVMTAEGRTNHAARLRGMVRRLKKLGVVRK